MLHVECHDMRSTVFSNTMIPNNVILALTKVTVHSTAIFQVIPQQTLISGTSGIISCSTQGTPAPRFEKWSRADGKPLEEERFTQLANGSMRVYPVRPNDKGEYICAIQQTKGDERTTRKTETIDVSVVGR